MSVYSGYATLFIVTAIFPCIILIISIVNLLPGYSAKDVADIFFQILPDLGPIRELVESMMVNLKSQSGGLLASAAAVTTLWSASKGVSAVQPVRIPGVAVFAAPVAPFHRHDPLRRRRPQPYARRADLTSGGTEPRR